MPRGLEQSEENLEELELVASVAAGESEALATLYDRYAPLLMGLAMKILQDKAEVEDLLHDVFVEVWQKAGSYDPARGTVRTWLCLRMRSRALDRSKLSRRTRSESLDARPSGSEEQQTQNNGVEVLQRERLAQALQALPDPQRNVISMAYFQGLSCSEIASALNVPIGTVKSRLAGAKRGLEKAMADAGELRHR
jgi:RNA polymerase sigma-70 factor (ECF subfamily)